MICDWFYSTHCQSFKRFPKEWMYLRIDMYRTSCPCKLFLWLHKELNSASMCHRISLSYKGFEEGIGIIFPLKGTVSIVFKHKSIVKSIKYWFLMDSQTNKLILRIDMDWDVTTYVWSTLMESEFNISNYIWYNNIFH